MTPSQVGGKNSKGGGLCVFVCFFVFFVFFLNKGEKSLTRKCESV